MRQHEPSTQHVEFELPLAEQHKARSDVPDREIQLRPAFRFSVDVDVRAVALAHARPVERVVSPALDEGSGRDID